jgi:hypothetical protein
MYAGDYQTASREASDMLKENPQFEKAYVAMALSALGQEHSQDADKVYQKLKAATPKGSSMAATGLADLAVLQGRLDDAVKTLHGGIAADEAAKRMEEAARKNADLAQVYVKLNRMGEARQAAQRAVAGTVDIAALTEAAVAYIDAGAPAEAAEISAKFGQRSGPKTR